MNRTNSTFEQSGAPSLEQLSGQEANTEEAREIEINAEEALDKLEQAGDQVTAQTEQAADVTSGAVAEQARQHPGAEQDIQAAGLPDKIKNLKSQAIDERLGFRARMKKKAAELLLARRGAESEQEEIGQYDKLSEKDRAEYDTVVALMQDITPAKEPIYKKVPGRRLANGKRRRAKRRIVGYKENPNPVTKEDRIKQYLENTKDHPLSDNVKELLFAQYPWTEKIIEGLPEADPNAKPLSVKAEMRTYTTLTGRDQKMLDKVFELYQEKGEAAVKQYFDKLNERIDAFQKDGKQGVEFWYAKKAGEANKSGHKKDLKYLDKEGNLKKPLTEGDHAPVSKNFTRYAADIPWLKNILDGAPAPESVTPEDRKDDAKIYKRMNNAERAAYAYIVEQFEIENIDVTDEVKSLDDEEKKDPAKIQEIHDKKKKEVVIKLLQKMAKAGVLTENLQAYLNTEPRTAELVREALAGQPDTATVTEERAEEALKILMQGEAGDDFNRLIEEASRERQRRPATENVNSGGDSTEEDSGGGNSGDEKRNGSGRNQEQESDTNDEPSSPPPEGHGGTTKDRQDFVDKLRARAGLDTEPDPSNTEPVGGELETLLGQLRDITTEEKLATSRAARKAEQAPETPPKAAEPAAPEPEPEPEPEKSSTERLTEQFAPYLAGCIFDFSFPDVAGHTDKSKTRIRDYEGAEKRLAEMQTALESAYAGEAWKTKKPFLYFDRNTSTQYESHRTINVNIYDLGEELDKAIAAHKRAENKKMEKSVRESMVKNLTPDDGLSVSCAIRDLGNLPADFAVPQDSLDPDNLLSDPAITDGSLRDIEFTDTPRPDTDRYMHIDISKPNWADAFHTKLKALLPKENEPATPDEPAPKAARSAPDTYSASPTPIKPKGAPDDFSDIHVGSDLEIAEQLGAAMGLNAAEKTKDREGTPEKIRDEKLVMELSRKVDNGEVSHTVGGVDIAIESIENDDGTVTMVVAPLLSNKEYTANQLKQLFGKKTLEGRKKLSGKLSHTADRPLIVTVDKTQFNTALSGGGVSSDSFRQLIDGGTIEEKLTLTN